MVYKISIDKEKCIGCQSCVAVCDESFEMKNGKAVPKHEKIEDNDLSCEKEAEEICPVNAIKVEKE